MTHLLDTDHMSILQHRGGPEYAVLLANMSRHAEDDIGVPIVSVQEQFLGAHARINAARTPAEVVRGYEFLLAAVEDFREFPLVPFDAPAAALFAQLRAQGIRIGTPDLRIAAIARSRNLVVVTRNVRDFGRVPGLTTEDWTK